MARLAGFKPATYGLEVRIPLIFLFFLAIPGLTDHSNSVISALDSTTIHPKILINLSPVYISLEPFHPKQYCQNT